jgi:hypothetical protein
LKNNNLFHKVIAIEIIIIVVCAILILALKTRPVSSSKSDDIMENVYIQLSNGEEVSYTKVKLILVNNGNNSFVAIVPRRPMAEEKVKDIKKEIYAKYQYYYLTGLGRKWLSTIAQYENIVVSASNYTHQDPDVLISIIAIESNGDPQAENEISGASGLMQILWVPKECIAEMMTVLKISKLNLADPVQNIYLGAITLRHYTALKNGDLAMGLLSYYKGPYDAVVLASTDYHDYSQKDWVDKVAKKYVIKALAMTLMSKVKRQYGQILPYNEEFKTQIETIELPGLDY